MSFDVMSFGKRPAASASSLSPEFLRKRKFLLVLPAIVTPFLFFIFYSLGGGKDPVSNDPKKSSAGFNATLPEARFDHRKPASNKLDVYKQAEQDSLRRKEYLRQDPYRGREGGVMPPLKSDTAMQSPGPVISGLSADGKANELLKELDRLKQSIRQPAERPAASTVSLKPRERVQSSPPEAGDADEDPQLEKLNGMLDKIIRIQHPEGAAVASMPADTQNTDTAAANSLPAVVQEDQTLVAGATIALRLTEAVQIKGVAFPKDQLVYGVVSIRNDRMLISVNSIRREQSIYSTALQAYDMDGLPGIHIPGDPGRETAKESADQGIHSLGMTAFDPSLAGQVAGAGVLTAKSLLSRKVRLVRVVVRAGYQVLLRGERQAGNVQVLGSVVKGDIQTRPDTVKVVDDPGAFVSFMHHSVRKEKMELSLRGIYLRNDLLWLVLWLENHSPIGYSPAYIHWSIRDRRQRRRTAIQETSLQPLYTPTLRMVEGDSGRAMLVAFRPFALPRDKELVLQLAERNGARELVLEIGGKELLKAKSDQHER